jgi:hypothetical protein
MSNSCGTIKHAVHVSCKSQIHTRRVDAGLRRREGGRESDGCPRSARRTPDFLSSLLALANFVRLNPLQNESRRACPERVERGRLNLAQDAVLG